MGRNRISRAFVKLNMVVTCLFLFVISGICSGCGSSDTKIVLTTGLKADEVFRIEDMNCTKSEMMIYITNMQNQYENVYGDKIWDTEVEGQSLETNVKENALAKMAQVKTMNLMARDRDIELSTQEIKQAENAAQVYFSSLNSQEIKAMDIDVNTITSLYREYMIAEKVYEDIIKDINPEVSDDEARNITVEYILIKTYTKDGTGKRIGFTENAQKSAYKRATQAYDRAMAGEEFESLIAEYSDSDEMEMSVGKGDITDVHMRSILFDLHKDEVSDIITTDEGFYIVKCLNTYDQEETDRNKIKIVEQEKESVFGATYDEYVEGLTRKLNDSLWDSISFIHDPEVKTSDFFEVADQYLD